MEQKRLRRHRTSLRHRNRRGCTRRRRESRRGSVRRFACPRGMKGRYRRLGHCTRHIAESTFQWAPLHPQVPQDHMVPRLTSHRASHCLTWLGSWEIPAMSCLTWVNQTPWRRGRPVILTIWGIRGPRRMVVQDTHHCLPSLSNTLEIRSLRHSRRRRRGGQWNLSLLHY